MNHFSNLRHKILHIKLLNVNLLKYIKSNSIKFNSVNIFDGIISCTALLTIGGIIVNEYNEYNEYNENNEK